MKKYDLETILDLIEDGDSFEEIAETIGITRVTLRKFLQENEENISRSARARENSAEAWLEKGWKELKSAKSDPNEIARARALAQECARRAAIRNPKYSEKRQVEHSGADGGPIVVNIRKFGDRSSE